MRVKRRQGAGMRLWKQATAAAVLVSGTGLVWALYVPAAGPVIARLGLPIAVDAPDENAGGGGGPGGNGATLVVGAAVGEGLTNDRVSAIGDGRAVRSVTITPLDSGRLIAIEVKPGDRIAEGEVIARLDSEAEEIAVARAELALAEAEETMARVERLRGTGAATDVQERDAARAVEAARLELRDAELALDRRRITAPFPGLIGILPVEVGTQVSTTSEIVTVDDRSSLLVDFRVPERFVGQLRPGQALSARPLAMPGLELEGRVTALDNRIDPESRTLRVRAELPNDDDRLRAGMAFAVELRFAGDPYPRVDPLAIQWGAEGAYVWVSRDGAAERVPIRIVKRNVDAVLVAGALQPGDRVVTEGVQNLRPGAALRFVGDPPDARGLSRAERALSDG
jgi:RND family efflux transporter MFP subunit